jgi:hypothetical protein
MEHEEYEEIPWSSLLPTGPQRGDRRWYVVAALVGVVIVAVLGFRLLRPAAQPEPMAAVTEAPSESPGAADVGAGPAPDVGVPGAVASTVVSEEELMGEQPADADALAVLAAAEWFVTDWYTRDGSAETVRSLADLLGTPLELPHGDPEQSTFVEWARALAVVTDAQRATVTVAYRAIHREDDAFVRDPVRVVTVSMTSSDGRLSVDGAPEPGIWPALPVIDG